MSSGQQAWAAELDAEAHSEHNSRLRQIGTEKIAALVDEAYESLLRLEKELPGLSRSGWHHFDALKVALRGLK